MLAPSRSCIHELFQNYNGYEKRILIFLLGPSDYDNDGVKSRLGGSLPQMKLLSKIMHWMDARALRRKDASKRRKAMGRDSVCDPWISDRETVSKLRG